MYVSFRPSAKMRRQKNVMLELLRVSTTIKKKK